MKKISEMRRNTSAYMCEIPLSLRSCSEIGMIALIWSFGFCLCTLSLLRAASAEVPDTASAAQEQVATDTADASHDEGIINGTAEDMERDEKKGLTILIGHVKIKRPNGFLNADKVTLHEDVATGEYFKTVAEGNVEIRDEDIFATCEHAILNHTDDTVDLRGNVVVLQNADRLEAKHFTFNRRTGKQTADGGVKFKVRMTRQTKTTEDKG